MAKDEIIVPDEIMEEYGDLMQDTAEETPKEAYDAAEDAAEDSVEEEAGAEGVEGGDEETAAEEVRDERTVPLAALQQERAERRKLRDELSKARAITDRLLAATGAGSLDELEGKMDETEKLRIMRERGLDEDTAQMFLSINRENSALRKLNDARRYDDEVAALSGNPFYNDIADVRDEVEEYARSKGISAKEAYNALFAEERAKRLQEEARSRAIKERETKNSKKIKGLSAAGNSPAAEGSLGLSTAELQAAKAAGISPADYKKYKEME